MITGPAFFDPSLYIEASEFIRAGEFQKAIDKLNEMKASDKEAWVSFFIQRFQRFEKLARVWNKYNKKEF